MPEKHTQHLAAILGANIVGRRQLMGMNQAELAARLDIAPDALSRIENGYTAPRVSRIEQRASILRCSPAELFREPLSGAKSNAVYLEELLRPLSAQQQEELLAIMTHIVNMLHKV